MICMHKIITRNFDTNRCHSNEEQIQGSRCFEVVEVEAREIEEKVRNYIKINWCSSVYWIQRQQHQQQWVVHHQPKNKRKWMPPAQSTIILLKNTDTWNATSSTQFDTFILVAVICGIKVLELLLFIYFKHRRGLKKSYISSKTSIAWWKFKGKSSNFPELFL